MSEWVDNFFVSELLSKEAGIARCLDNVVHELEALIRHNKFLATTAYLPHLNAPPNDVTNDLILQRCGHESLSIYVKSRIVNHTNNTEINYSGPLH